MPLFGGTALAADGASGDAMPLGHDVSSHQGNVNWNSAHDDGATFAYVKATEAISYLNPYFDQQYDGARSAGLVRGAYHFGLPDSSSGKSQATYFLEHGGGGKADGWTLPPALDIEGNPYGAECYGLSASQMVSWITAFSDEVQRQTGRRPVLYTTLKWWKDCTGNNVSLGTDHLLWLAHWGSSFGTLPAGWSKPTFWQFASSGDLPGDQDRFNGTSTALKQLASQ
jgi:GH25 family lysozyme M1 (1,4-beta-N-acetylmuramidase)